MGGMAVIAFSTSIVTTALSEKLAVLKEEKVIGEASSLKNFVIICGFGRMGKSLSEEFTKFKQKFVIVDVDDSSFSHANTQNYLMIKGDATDAKLLNDIGLNSGASSIIAMTNDDSVNLAIILTARSQNPNIKIIARANHESTKKKLVLAGADYVVSPHEVTALIAAEYIGQPVAFEAIDDILLDSEGAVMDEIEILENSNYIGFKLQDIDFSKFNLTFIGVMSADNRKSFKFNPKKDQYIIQARDILIVIGYKESIIQFKVELLSTKPKLFGKIKKKIKNDQH
jgi:voltage-gated potassium channel